MQKVFKMLILEYQASSYVLGVLLGSGNSALWTEYGVLN